MELSLSREDAAFRDEVRAFIAQNYPQEMRVPNPERDLTKEQSFSQMSRGVDPGPAASLFKIRGTEIFQRITELALRAIGQQGLALREHALGGNVFMPGPDYGHTAAERDAGWRQSGWLGS